MTVASLLVFMLAVGDPERLRARVHGTGEVLGRLF
jgi:hypothetical protein